MFAGPSRFDLPAYRVAPPRGFLRDRGDFPREIVLRFARRASYFAFYSRGSRAVILTDHIARLNRYHALLIAQLTHNYFIRPVYVTLINSD